MEAAIDPCQNLVAAAHFLDDNYRRAVSLGRLTPLVPAPSADSAGTMQCGYSNGYVEKVYSAPGNRPLASATRAWSLHART